MGLDVIPKEVRDRYHVVEIRHACAILSCDFPKELQDILACLTEFELLRSEIVKPGGRKTKITARFDDFLQARRWKEMSVKVSRTVNDVTTTSETHKVDFFKGKIAVEVEWNSKDSVFARDLNAYRLLHELQAVSVGVMITRRDELQEIFDSLKVGDKYGASTTHWGKLWPRIEAGGAGACPMLLIGITKNCYRDDTEAA